ncbi:uncharacterized protein LOC130931937 isoform X6 [Corythoichthys intestinalis]|uniref:uncharacterized protein LOC130931937 isoform X6 n=1 Tax=Corythoichthys intestinalis TaxID=161448 RepID=UPI0025A4FE7A|nr:uncharacterized protein LOC130931937 isoform X6 [Corythoichthys intestinalis]
MSARPAGANFQEHLRGVKEEPPRHRPWTVCKLGYKLMHNKLVLSSLEDVGRAHRPEHQESACIEEEEFVHIKDVSRAPRPEHQESACIEEEEEEEKFVHIKGFRKYLGADGQEPESPGVKEDVERPLVKEEEPKSSQQMQLPIKKEEEELPYIEEKGHITRSTAHDSTGWAGLCNTPVAH